MIGRVLEHPWILAWLAGWAFVVIPAVLYFGGRQCERSGRAWLAAAEKREAEAREIAARSGPGAYGGWE